MVNTKVTLCGIEMDNPIIPASGTFGFGYEFAELYDINVLGTFSFKGTTREPHFGNPTPRIAEYAGGLLNAVGLQNPGVDAVIETELPKLKQVFHKPVMANVSGFSVAEYAEVCEKLDAQEQVGWLEVNIDVYKRQERKSALRGKRDGERVVRHRLHDRRDHRDIQADGAVLLPLAVFDQRRFERNAVGHALLRGVARYEQVLAEGMRQMCIRDSPWLMAHFRLRH